MYKLVNVNKVLRIYFSQQPTANSQQPTAPSKSRNHRNLDIDKFR
jgi:hypothetical protein